MQNTNDYSPVQTFLHNKWVRIVLIANAIIIIVIICLLIWQSTKVSTVNLNITPVDATISINGDKKYQNGQYSITPGTYNVTISHEGLEPKNFTIDVAPQSVVTISTFLSDKDHTFDFYKLRKNYPSYAKLEEIASADNNITTETFIKRFQEDYEALTTKLPIDHSETIYQDGFYEIKNSFNIIARNDCTNTLCIQVNTLSANDKEYINAIIQEKGLNVEDFEIEYKYY